MKFRSFNLALFPLFSMFVAFLSLVYGGPVETIFVMYFLFTCIFLLLIAFNYKRHISLLGFMCFLILFVFIEPIIFIISEKGFPVWSGMTTSRQIDLNYLFVLSFFCSFISISYFLFSYYSSPSITRCMGFGENKLTNRSVFILLLLLLVGLYPYFSNGLNGFFSIILSGRGANGFSQFDIVASGNTSFTFILSNLLIGVSVLVGYILISKVEVSHGQKLLLVIMFVLCFLIIASGGGRTRLGFILVPLLIVYLIFNGSSILGKFKFFSIAIAFLVPIMSMVSLRDNGVELFSKVFDISQLELVGMNLNRELYYILGNDGSFPIACDTHLSCAVKPPLDTLYSFLSNPIPRVLFPDKYLDPSFAIYNNMRVGSTGLGVGSNVTPTVIGRYFMLYGIMGVFFVASFLGALLAYADRLLLSPKSAGIIIFSSGFSYFLMQSVRDFKPGWLYPVIFTYFVYMCVKSNLERKRN